MPNPAVLTSRVGAAPTRSTRSRPKEVALSRHLPTRTAVVAGTVLVLLVAAGPSWASPLPPEVQAAAAPSLNGVIDSLRTWLVGILATLATLFLTIGGIRYLLAGGDPMQVERAKTALKSAAIGYALAVLAPLLVSILTSVVGG
jgi:hypothetical protein